MSFLKNYIISLVVLVGLYVVLDMVFNFDEFVQVSGQAGTGDSPSAFETVKLVALYYGHQSFRVFSYLAGVVPVVATAFTLMRMSRFNELAALLAAGIPLGRVAAPIIIASLVVNNALLFVNQEFIVPSMIEDLTRDRGEQQSGLENRILRAMPDGPHGLLFAGAYTPPRPTTPATLDVVDHFDISDKGILHITADHATFDPATSSWKLVNGHSAVVTTGGGTRGVPQQVQTLPQSSITPETIALFVSRGEFVDLLSTTRINQLLALRTTVGRLDLMRVRDARWASYFLNVILVLLTIPCVLTREPMQLRTAAARVFILVGLCMATIFITQSLAGQPPADPALAAKWPGIMAFAPIFIFGIIAVYLLDRLKT
jgi:lipopolysaccharide export system permease protein